MRKATLLIAPSLLGLFLLLGLYLWLPKGATVAAATPPQSVTIETTKLKGSPVPGTWTASGLLADAGTFHALSIHFSASGAPTFQVTHVTYEFDSPNGTFTLQAQITETLTADPNILTDDGPWMIQGGTGAYATLHGHGQVAGTVNENTNLITRTYSGDAHFA